jgi:acyl-CoA synthetase (AMP-forming)/AMP-acid ligase II/thioesterase domain-containing protein
LTAAYQTIGDTIRQFAVLDPSRIALIGAARTPITFNDLAGAISRIGGKLSSAGHDSSSRIAVVLPHGLDAAVLNVAVAAHCTNVPLNPGLTASELSAELARFQVDALVIPAGAPLPDWSERRNSPLTVFRATTGACACSLVCEVVGPGQTRESAKPSCNSVALMLRSSGTTGVPRTVPLTHGNLIALAERMRSWFAISREDRCGCVLPTYYAQGCKTALLAPLLVGAGVAIPQVSRCDELARWVPELSPTWFSASPTLLRAILEKLERQGGEPLPHRLRFVLSSASYLPEPIRVGIEKKLGVPVLEHYGLSEAGIMAANPVPPAKRKPGSVGRIVPDEVAIRGRGAELLQPGVVGEIVVRGPTLTPAAHLADGWMLTGDLGAIDEEGFLSVVGRTSETINRGGEKILPYEVEKALLLHPAVKEAAVCPVSHPRLGQNVAAAVVLADNASVTPVELKEFVGQRIARFKVPQRILVLTALPKNANGKLARARLRQLIETSSSEPAAPRAPLELQIADIWKNLIGRSSIGVNEDFFEAGGDSLLEAEMLLEVEKLVGKRVIPAVSTNSFTIRQLAHAVAQDIQSDPGPVTAARVGDWTPLFFCHGDYNTGGLYAVRLASHFPSEQPVFLVHPSLDFDASTTIEGMAAACLPQLLALQPSGAFRLAGHCNGGLLAWELARRLIDAGRAVELVVLIETFSVNARPLVRAVASAAERIGLLGGARGSDRLRAAILQAIWTAARGLRSPMLRRTRGLSNHHQPLTAWDRADRSMLRVMARYVPQRLETDVICLLCDTSIRAARFRPRPWAGLARDFDVAQLAGEHLTCITTHAATLAAVMTPYLKTASQRTVFAEGLNLEP